MESLNLKKVYLWGKNSIYAYPWQRQFLNLDFLKFEQKRIRDVIPWFENFFKAREGDKLNEVYYYVIPSEIPSDWKAAIAAKGNFNYFYVSALKNSPQMELLCILPNNIAVPKERTLIRITKAKKDVIINSKTFQPKYVVNIESFEEVDDSVVYIDVPFERKSIHKFIYENIIKDEFIARSIQPTISSAPFVLGKRGGVSYSTFCSRTAFTDEFNFTLKKILPHDFSDIQFLYPESLLKGKIFTDPLTGIKYHIAERPSIGKNYFSVFSANDYKRLDLELDKRSQFRGEYSIACSLTPRGNEAELLRDILSKFVKTEIMQPYNTNDFLDLDMDLENAQNNITEDVWLQVANQRQFTPIVTNDEVTTKLREELLNHWGAILDSLGLKKNIEPEVRVYSKATFDNILRVAQSIARDEQVQEVNKSIISQSLKLFLENSELLLKSKPIQHVIHTVIPEYKENKKLNAVRAELSVNTLSIQELFENLKDIFETLLELQEFVDKLQKEGWLFEPRMGVYRWI